MNKRVNTNNIYKTHFDFQSLVVWAAIMSGVIYVIIAMTTHILFDHPISYLDKSYKLIWQSGVFLFAIKGFIELLDDKESGNTIKEHYSIGEYAKNGLARVYIGNKYGFINQDGVAVIPFVYDYAHDFRDDGLAVVMQSGKWGSIDTKGEIV